MLTGPTRFLSMLALSLAFTGCDPEDGEAEGSGSGTDTDALPNPCDGETRDDSYAVGLSKMGSTVTVAFVDAMPAPPAKGDNVWLLLVSDAAGQPMPGVTFMVSPFMPDHGHGTPTPTIVTEVEGAEGQYLLEDVSLFMAGLWEVTVDLTLPGGEADSVVFSFCMDP